VSEKETAKQLPGKSLRIAAQGILNKPDGGHRIIHDGTHGVRLNNEIQVLDRLACSKLQYKTACMTPHVIRHSAASNDSYHRRRNLAEVQKTRQVGKQKECW
jgi:hypothetical protein